MPGPAVGVCPRSWADLRSIQWISGACPGVGSWVLVPQGLPKGTECPACGGPRAEHGGARHR